MNATRQITAEPSDRVDLDALAAEWWEALAAEDSALRVGVPELGRLEVAARSHHLAQERAETTGLLTRLGRELGLRSRLVPWVGAPAVTARMLGLPNDVRACVFDLDGVLTTSAEAHAASWTQVFDAFLVSHSGRHHRPFVAFDQKHDYEELVAGRPRHEGIRAFLASRGIDLPEGNASDPPAAETVHGLANRKNEVLRRYLERRGVAAVEGSHSYLEAVRMAGLGCAVVSPSLHTRTMLERAGLEQLVEVRIDGQTIAAEDLEAKPAPDMLLAACRDLGVAASRAAAFEISPVGVAAARAARFAFVVGVARTGEADLLRASDIDLVVTELGELLGGGSNGDL